MRRALVLFALVVAPILVGCGGDPPPEQPSSAVGRFVSLTNSGINIDYEPLASPQDAVSQADLIVEGALADVVDGIGLTYPDPRYTARRAGAYATFVVTVDRVLSGDPAKVLGGRVYVTVDKSSAADIGELAGANPQPRIVTVLSDITGWTPAPDVRVDRPDAVPAGATLYAPYTDGIWLQGAADTLMYGLYADPGELAAPWGRPRTVGQFSAAIRQAT
jgi:hypothetical protein